MTAVLISRDELRARLRRRGEHTPDWTHDAAEAVEIPLELIAIVGRAPYETGAVDRIADDMIEHGQRVACRVRPAGAGAEHGLAYELVDGVLRYQSAQTLGFVTLRCVALPAASR